MHYTAKFIDVFWLLTKNRTCTYHTPHTSNEWPTPGIHWLHPHGIQLYTITFKNIKVIKMIKAVDEVLPQDLRCSVLEKSFFLFFFSKLNGQLTEILLRNNMSTFDNTLYHHSRAPKKNTSYGNARYNASHTKTMLPTRKSLPISSRQLNHTKTFWPS